jgi:acetoin utilization deacetylase AcuC-like enzyme
MATTAVVVDRDYLRHDPGDGHPERPERIAILLALADELDRQKFQLLPPRPATRDEIALRHHAEYIKQLESTSRFNGYALDGDTITCRDSFAVGVLAVGGFLRLLDAIGIGDVRNGFALVRPPGHHALRDRAMGFCLFNTIAIGADYLKRNHGAKKILIVDWDVHHGNGTQEAFYEDPTVFFISTHQYPYYPGTGALTEVGAGAGEGLTLNIPLPAGYGDGEYVRVFDDVVLPFARAFEPEWILVSAGFDPHRRDPLGGMTVTEAGFTGMAQALLELAERYTDGKIAFLLEGGYDLQGLSASVAAVLDTIQKRVQKKTIGQIRTNGDDVAKLVRRIRQVHEKYGLK